MTNPTSVAFGGIGGHDLYITTSWFAQRQPPDRPACDRDDRPETSTGAIGGKAGDMAIEVSGRVAYRHAAAGGVETAVTRAVTRAVGDAEGDQMQALKAPSPTPRRSSPRAKGERAMFTPENERRMVVAAEDDLHREFPDVPTEQIHSLVVGIWAGFVTARVREFVPVLVRAAARNQLRVRNGPSGPSDRPLGSERGRWDRS